MIRLHVNVDHVATVRNQRDTQYPDPIAAARLCLEAGAQGITMHLREDRRHIRDDDVRRFARELPGAVLNLEMAATEEMATILSQVRPHACTLVPERREERTTEGGLDVRGARLGIERVAKAAREVGTRLSLFIEPDLEQVRLSRDLGAVQVEFHTGHYCHVPDSEREAVLEALSEAAILAHELGLEVAAGHGLNVGNVGPIAALPHLAELNIGHAIVSDAILLGLAEATRAMRSAIDRGAHGSAQAAPSR